MKKSPMTLILLSSLLFSCASEITQPSLPSTDPEIKEVDLNTEEIYNSGTCKKFCV